MSSTSHARQRIAAAALTPSSMARSLRRTVPMRNCVGLIDYEGLLNELREFGIFTNRQFRKLMLKHRRALIEADREPLTPQMEKIFREEWGDDLVADRLRRQYWYSWGALTRLALELEFGERYRQFADRRDGLLTDTSDSAVTPSARQGIRA
jgi:hypothetical protein